MRSTNITTHVVRTALKKTSLDPKIRLEYLFSKTKKNDGCFEWIGNRTNDYAKITFNKKTWYGHRLVWTLSNGEIPKGIKVLHKCDNPPCINPDHLFLGTQLENMLDKISKGRCPTKAKTHCKRGHPFDNVNTMVTKQGRRKCRACDKIYKRGNYATSKKNVLSSTYLQIT